MRQNSPAEPRNRLPGPRPAARSLAGRCQGARRRPGRSRGAAAGGCRRQTGRHRWSASCRRHPARGGPATRGPAALAFADRLATASTKPVSRARLPRAPDRVSAAGCADGPSNVTPERSARRTASGSDQYRLDRRQLASALPTLLVAPSMERAMKRGAQAATEASPAEKRKARCPSGRELAAAHPSQ